jgi:hypothetical protein
MSKKSRKVPKLLVWVKINLALRDENEEGDFFCLGFSEA